MLRKLNTKKNTKNSQFSDCWVVRLVHIEIEFVSECNVQCASHVSLSCDANEWEYWNILERKCIKFMSAHRTTTTIMYIYYIHTFTIKSNHERSIYVLSQKLGCLWKKLKVKFDLLIFCLKIEFERPFCSFCSIFCSLLFVIIKFQIVHVKVLKRVAKKQRKIEKWK